MRFTKFKGQYLMLAVILAVALSGFVSTAEAQRGLIIARGLFNPKAPISKPVLKAPKSTFGRKWGGGGQTTTPRSWGSTPKSQPPTKPFMSKPASEKSFSIVKPPAKPFMSGPTSGKSFSVVKPPVKSEPLTKPIISSESKGQPAFTVVGGKSGTLNSATSNAGRAGKQSRLRSLGQDQKVSSADRGWIKQEVNQIDRGKRTSIRNPPGKDLAHDRGREAAKGFDYKHSTLQDKSLHRLQHKYDSFGKKNKVRPIKDIGETNR